LHAVICLNVCFIPRTAADILMSARATLPNSRSAHGRSVSHLPTSDKRKPKKAGIARPIQLVLIEVNKKIVYKLEIKSMSTVPLSREYSTIALAQSPPTHFPFPLFQLLHINPVIFIFCVPVPISILITLHIDGAGLNGLMTWKCCSTSTYNMSFSSSYTTISSPPFTI
jgi:hypothetical protein